MKRFIPIVVQGSNFRHTISSPLAIAAPRTLVRLDGYLTDIIQYKGKMTRILGALAAAFLGLTIYGIVDQGNLWFPLMVLLGATIGIIMGLSYPFALATKIALILGLIASAWIIYYGFKNHDKPIGQILAVGGICVWSFIGLMGLGTGT